MPQRAIQRRFCVWIAGEQVRRGQIRRRSLYDGWLVNPAEGCAGPVYIPPGFQGGPSEIGVLNSYWLLTWDAVKAERTGRSGDASSKHFWFQAEVLELPNSYWPLTSGGSRRWNPCGTNSHWLAAQVGLRGQLNFYWPRRPTASLYGDEVAGVLEACASCPRAAYFLEMQERSGQQGGDSEEAWCQRPN